MMRTKPIQTTKWGTACAQCAAAKAKCSGRSGNLGSKCDRCERLLKQCTDQVHKPRKTRQSRDSRQTADTGSPSFEFDSLVSTPEHPSSPMAGDLTGESSSVGSYLSASQDRPFLIRTASSHSQQNADGGFVATSGTHRARSSYPSPGSFGQHRSMVLEGREDIDQVLLSKYRTELMPQHPFVIIPPHIPAAVLRSHHPFLMISIRAIASFEGLHTMHTRMQLVTGHIADKMFRQAERSLDLLMGIVVILGWHHYHCARHSQLNNLLCLAESLVSDLGLNKKPPVNHDGEEDERATEEKRVLLGVWYLRSSAAMHLRQLTSMPFTQYMRQCLVEIQEAKTHDLDETLVHCVKTQYLAERVAVLKTIQPRRTDVGNDRIALEGGEKDEETQERGAALAGCQAYLDRLVRELPGDLKDNALIVTQFNTVALRFSEPRGSEVLQCHPAEGSPTSRLPYPSDSPKLDALLQAAPLPLRSWFQSWISCVPVSRYRTLPSHAVFQLLYALRAVVRSQTAEHGNMHGSLQGQKPSTSTSLAVPRGDAPVPLDHVESNPFEDAMTVMNRLIALGPNGADVDKFWAALGEMYEDELALGRAAAEHPSTPDGLAGLGEDVFNAAMIMAGRGQSSESTHGDTYPMLQSPGAQGMYSSELFVPPSRVGSATMGHRGYNDGSLLRPSPMTVVPGASQPPSAQAHQWAAATTWNADPSPWTAPGPAPDAMGHEGMDQQLWDASQGNPPYGWGNGTY